jgi:hypothetical protein
LIGALAGVPAGPAAAVIMAAGGAAIGNAADLIAEDDFTEFADNVAGAHTAGKRIFTRIIAHPQPTVYLHQVAAARHKKRIRVFEQFRCKSNFLSCNEAD